MTARGTLIDNWDGSAHGAFAQSWHAIAGDIDVRQRAKVVGGRRDAFATYGRQGNKLVQLSGKFVSMDVDIRFDYRFQQFMNRLDLLGSPKEKALFKRTLRRVTRTTILPVLRSEIPKGKRSRLRPRSLRSTAQIYRVFDDRILLTVGRSTKWLGPKGGRYGLWHASVVHARWHPFFPIAFRKTWKPFNRAISAELNNLLRYLAGKAPLKYGGLRAWH